MLLDVLNVLVFAFGCCIFGASAVMLRSHVKWARSKPLGRAIIAFLAENVICVGCVLVFSANTAMQAVTTDHHNDLNKMDPVTAIILRIILLSPSAVSIAIVRQQVAKEEAEQEAERKRRQELASDLLTHAETLSTQRAKA